MVRSIHGRKLDKDSTTKYDRIVLLQVYVECGRTNRSRRVGAATLHVLEYAKTHSRSTGIAVTARNLCHEAVIRARTFWPTAQGMSLTLPENSRGTALLGAMP